jgi:hypothetical protein
VAAPQQPPRHVGAHAAQPDHAKFHRCLQQWNPRIMRDPS